jgi:Helix-turn-helix domain
VVSSIGSAKLLNPAPFSDMVARTFRRSLVDRARRSNTSRTSPELRAAIALARAFNQIRERVAMNQPGRKRDRRSKLTDEDVAQIKAYLQQGKNPAILARYFEVSKSTIYDIRAMRRWRRVTTAARATPLSELYKTRRRI